MQASFMVRLYIQEFGLTNHLMLDIYKSVHSATEVRFASFLFGGFTTTVVINPPESKLGKCTSVHCCKIIIMFTEVTKQDGPKHLLGCSKIWGGRNSFISSEILLY